MKLVWLHGAPAAGKLTVAKVLHEKYGYKLFHNHLTVDLSLSIYESFGLLHLPIKLDEQF
ncbi:hypothetical protein [Vibrio harveyi]|uniref:hypothetical protein n=1 Tax=Vibrio harveyi TaxID=669 RepID=UPI0023805ED7|nr:hypothetical protein [Vibrio harveyi]WDZ72023.1 hypothetical protein PWW31_13440 [Vibrio harveyi]